MDRAAHVLTCYRKTSREKSEANPCRMFPNPVQAASLGLFDSSEVNQRSWFGFVGVAVGGVVAAEGAAGAALAPVSLGVER